MVRAVGLRGEVEIAVESDDPERFAVGSVVRTDERELTVATSRDHNGRTIVSFDGVIDRTGAEALKGTILMIPADKARKLEPDEYWDHDLLGLPVVTVTGVEIGPVTDVLHQPSGELLVIGKHLVPLVREIVVEVTAERITIDPPDGLIN